jgi:1-acyl-sn-glycerol-3-phosphate acyltransferase
MSEYDEPVIIAANHQSELDSLVILTATYKFLKRKPLYSVSREKSFYTSMGWRGFFYGGRLFRFLGANPVYVKQNDYRITLKNHIEIISNGCNVCIFPEGTRTINGVISKAKGGVMFLAQETGRQIMPLVINGLYNSSFKDFIFRKRKVTITIGTPIFVEKTVNTYVPSNFEYYNNAASIINEHLQRLL